MLVAQSYLPDADLGCAFLSGPVHIPWVSFPPLSIMGGETRRRPSQAEGLSPAGME